MSKTCERASKKTSKVHSKRVKNSFYQKQAATASAAVQSTFKEYFSIQGFVSCTVFEVGVLSES